MSDKFPKVYKEIGARFNGQLWEAWFDELCSQTIVKRLKRTGATIKTVNINYHYQHLSFCGALTELVPVYPRVTTHITWVVLR